MMTWYCRTCQKPVALNVDGPQSRCDECGSVQLHPLHAPPARVPARVARADDTGGPLSPTVSAPLFASLRAAVG